MADPLTACHSATRPLSARSCAQLSDTARKLEEERLRRIRAEEDIVEVRRDARTQMMTADAVITAAATSVSDASARQARAESADWSLFGGRNSSDPWPGKSPRGGGATPPALSSRRR